MHVEKEQNDVKKGEKEEYLAQGSVGNEERKEKGEQRTERIRSRTLTFHNALMSAKEASEHEKMRALA
uniref:Uncharacterized protein n=1 Tax=Pristionchus pacificus TaxID=54126 RepID=A0A2A6C0U4_PRIPA|eukprot:PDM71770.1 hypothetical protein PRIPAC_38177 [Pristionchus pacificus]